ncbi:MAG: hypothetical protein M0Q51_00820 [Bacteroidales bacterium]|nr:hypothetical protein [Bacteroidales bacterium]
MKAYSMNIKNEKFLFSVVLIGVSINLFLHKTSFSQEGGEVWYNVVSVPPSPNAAALGKYGEIPVDKSTGIPNISIPILDLSEGGIDVSVSLSYHAGGIRVQDEATWVGLGWSLNAGGVITRTMRGLPDDHYNGFLENAEKVPSSGMIYNELSTPGIATTAYNRVNEIAKGYLDYEPDLFYYNYGKGSGSFMFGNHNQPINIPFDDVIIEPLYDSGILSGFILTAPDGIVYIFGNGTDYTETTHVEIEGPNPQDYISSWYLHQIINPLKNTDIYFDYESQPYSQGINYSATRMYEHDGFNYIPHSPDINPCNTDIDAKYLKLIGFKNGVITFNSSDSEDGGRKLDSIMFVTPISGTRKFKFNYDYFKVDYNSTLREELRLRLLSFIETYPYLERNLSLKNDKKYSFDYSPINLPPKTSNAIDYWGFFNGVTLNVNTIPKVLYGGLLLGDADREPDTTYSCAGVLTKINYPTGGSSEFKYENNAYGRLPTVEEITSPGGFEFFIVKGIEEHTEICETEPLHFDTNYNYINFVLHAEISINGTYDPTHHKGKVQILWDNGEVLFTADLIKDNPIVVPLENIDLTDMCVLKLCANGSVTTATAWITYEKYDPDELQIKREYLAGGLRIKEIKNYDHVTNKSTYKTFDYDKSGYLNTSFPSYYTLTTKRWAEPPCLLWYDRSIIMVYSSPIGGLGNSSNSVSYEKVIEYNGTTQVNNGKLVSTFLKYEDDPTGGMPYLPHLSYQYLRSKVLREEYFNFQAENNYGLIKLYYSPFFRPRFCFS